MKKVLLILALLCSTSISLFGTEKKEVVLSPFNKGTGTQIPGPKRTPIAIPEAFIDGNILSFDGSCIGCPVTLIDEEENIVFTAVVNEDGNMELPDNLSGTFKLQLERGSIIFVGEIKL